MTCQTCLSCLFCLSCLSCLPCLASQSHLATIPYVSCSYFSWYFSWPTDAGINLLCTTADSYRNLMLNAAFTRAHTVWDRPLRPRETPAVSERSSRIRRRLRSHRNSMTNLHGTVRPVQLPAERSPFYASRSAGFRPESRPLSCPSG